MLLAGIGKGLHDVAAHLHDRVFVGGAGAEYQGFAGGHVELDGCGAGTVLSAVVLLFHQQRKLVRGIHRRTVFLDIVAEGFQQTHRGNTAFMADPIAHYIPSSGYVRVWV